VIGNSERGSRETMSFTEKIDVLDLLINILREHEEKLDELVARLEVVSQTIQKDPDLKRSVMEYEFGKEAAEEEIGVSNILVVDDDKSLANTFKLVLQSVGFNVDTAITGLQALYKINRKQYDLVILDINLPDMLGDEVAEKIRETSSEINIIMITGYSSFKDDLKEEELGIKEVLLKPIPPEDLVKITKKTLLAKDQA
jgi:CheY-like chemotaxis protein